MPKKKQRNKNKIDNKSVSNDTIFDRGSYKKFKYCKNCKKIMTWRKKWANNWDEVKYCSQKCKKQKKNSNIKNSTE